MSLRDLKNLAPWQWESKVAQKKHAIGPKGIADFEQVARVLQTRSVGADPAQLVDKQSTCSKRRRSAKENEEPADTITRTPSEGTELATATPLIPAKKQRHSSFDDAIVAPNNDSTYDRHNVVAEVRSAEDTQLLRAATARTSAAATPAPAAKGVKRSAATALLAAAPTATATASPAAAKVSRTASTSLDAAALSGAAAALLTPAAACKGTTQGLSSSSIQCGRSVTGPTSASAKVLQSPSSCLKTPAGQTLKFRAVRAASCTAAAATPSLAAATPATLNPKDLLSEIFSPSPVPTPMPCARLAFKTPRSTVRPNVLSSAVREAGSSDVTVAAAGPSNRRNRAAMSGTPIPGPHFTPRSMAPPARRISGSGIGLSVHQQTLGGSAAAAAVRLSCNVSSSGKNLQSPMKLAGTPIKCRSDLAATATAAIAAEEDYRAHDLADTADQQHAAAAAAPAAAAAATSAASLNDSLASPAKSSGLIGVLESDVGRCSNLPEPALLQVASTATTAAVAAPTAQQGNGSHRASTAAGAGSKTCLPAKLRCKRASFNNTPAATQAHAAVAVNDKPSQLEQHQQQQDDGTEDAPAAEAAVEGAMLRTPTASRLGLKRRWCQNHAAAMAAEAAAAEEHAGSLARSPDSMALARSADLLLAAAAAADNLDLDHELDHHGDDPDLQSQQTLDNADAEPASTLTAMHLDCGPEEQQQLIRHRRLREVYNAAVAAAAATDEVAPWKHVNLSRKAAREGQQQQQMPKHKDLAVLDLSDFVAADNSVLGSSCGTSLLLPAAAQLRLQQQQDTAQLWQQSAKPLIGTESQDPAAAAAAADVTAAVLASVQCSQYMQQHRQLTPLQQFQLQQQQILAAAGLRVPHTTAAAQTAATRVMHSGAMTQQPGPMMHRATAAAAVAAARFGVWNGHLVLLHAHQQQESVGRSQSPGTNMHVAAAAASAVASRSRTATPEPLPTAAANTSTIAPQYFSSQPAVGKPQMHPLGAPAANSTSVGAADTISSSKKGADVNSEDLAVTPLSVPSTLSDDEAWKLAQAQPWVIELEAARARQLLAHAPVIAAATTGSI